MHRYFRIVLNLIGLGLCLFATFVALSWGWADLNTWPAERAIAIWDKSRAVTVDHDWNTIHNGMLQAKKLNPLKVEYDQKLGILHEWRAYQQRLSPANAMVQRKLANQFYSNTIVGRPTWGLAWSYYARNELAIDSLSKKGYKALENAFIYAPWDIETLRNIATTGITYWNDMGESTRHALEDVIIRLSKSNSQRSYLNQLARNYNWEAKLKQITTRIK